MPNIDEVIADINSRVAKSKSQDRVSAMVAEDIGSGFQQGQEPQDIDAVVSEIDALLPKKQEEQIQNEQQPTEERIIGGNPIQTIFNDMAKGYAESSIGFNQKLLAVNAILQPSILGKDEIQKRLTENVKYWEGVSSSMKYQDPNSWVWQMVGSAPLAGAEFAGTGAGVGSLALRGGALQALDEYGRKIAEEKGETLTPGQFAGQFAQGAAITGTIGLAFKGAGVSLEKLGAFIPKYGKKVFRNLAESMGVPTKEIDGFLADPKKYMAKSPQRYEDIYNKNQERVIKFRNKQEQELFEKKIEFRKQETEQIRRNELLIRDDEIAKKQIVDSKSDNVKQAISDLKETTRTSIEELNFNNREALANAAVKYDKSVKQAKDALDDEMTTWASGFKKTLDDYKGQVDTEIDDVLTRMVDDFPSEGAKTSNVIKNVLESVNSSRVFRASLKDGKFQIQSRVGNEIGDGVAKDIESGLNSLVNDFSENGVINMYKLRFNKGIYERVLPKKWLQEGLGEGTGFGKVSDMIGSALDVSNYIDDLSPSARKYISELKSVYKKYGDMKDTIKGFDALLYKDTADGKGRIFNAKYVINAIENNDKNFMRQLLSTEGKSQFKASAPLKRMVDSYKAIESEQLKFLTSAKIKADMSKKQAVSEFRNSLKGLKQQGSLVTQEGKALSAIYRKMSDDNAKETDLIREAFDRKLNDFRIKQKADIDELIKSAREEDDFFKAKQIFQSWRPGGGFPRVAQNIGLYGTVGSTVAGATGAIGAGTAAASAVAKGGLAYVMSPVVLSKMAQFSLKNKEIIKRASKHTIKAGQSIKGARLIQQLISKQISGY